MRKSILAACILLTALAGPVISFAQDDQKPAEAAKPAAPAEQVRFYRLTLIVQEVDSNNKPINSRSYVTTISTDKNFRGSIRTGSKVAIPTGTTGVFTYIDMGINFDIRDAREFSHQLALQVKAEIMSNTPNQNSTSAPIIRNNQWEGPVIVPIGKPSVIFSSDSLENKNAMQVVAIVTPIS
jgi:hypothetical protein